jgi:arylsulfatase
VIGEPLIYVNQIDLTATISLKASVPQAAFTSKGHFDQDQWQLYYVGEGRSESTDLAKQYPEKLDELKKACADGRRA